MILILHIKKYLNNFFIIISNHKGNVVFFRSAGMLGFKNIQKRSQEVAIVAYRAAGMYLSSIQNAQIFIKLEGMPLAISIRIRKLLFTTLKARNLRVQCILVVNKIPHNGCRKKK
jgi:ribosomal protein S11